MSLNSKKWPLPLEGVHPLFIDKGGGFTGERERVRVFLSLVAHARMRVVMIVGTHNTVDVARKMSGAHWGLHWLLQEGWMLVPAKYCWYVRSPTLCTRYGEP